MPTSRPRLAMRSGQWHRRRTANWPVGQRLVRSPPDGRQYELAQQRRKWAAAAAASQVYGGGSSGAVVRGAIRWPSTTKRVRPTAAMACTTLPLSVACCSTHICSGSNSISSLRHVGLKVVGIGTKLDAQALQQGFAAARWAVVAG
ncbi:uncharacterized protein PSFLO_06256 [Pseudozyma flocculosa]|uniref:Uncharacterized protein n=1 Tax=Pseudozyma flocculosa TaxID=84751 RepID=A0A5C3F8H7_9BASI|nr:uncharacterized protein PSFLO_06256 [Pseudozyma flocculosa]